MKVYPNLEREIVHESNTLADAFQTQGSNQTCFGIEVTVRLTMSMDCYTSFWTFSDVMTANINLLFPVSIQGTHGSIELSLR
jgi:hypothetical protein